MLQTERANDALTVIMSPNVTAQKWDWSNFFHLIPYVKPCSRCRQKDNISALRVQPLLYTVQT